MSRFILLLFTFCLALTPVDFEVTKLPGYESKLPFKTYSGYIPIPDSGKSMFFLFIESATNPTEDPVMLWLNGGPGCSSLEGGFDEIGPYYIDRSDHITINKYAWNMKANVIFLESPAFVGFSKSTNPSDITTDDEETTATAYAFLLEFFKIFKSYGSKLWLAGESYAGHYVPLLAKTILERKEIDLVGFMDGNPWTDAYFDNLGGLKFNEYHNIVSHQHAQDVREFCDLQHGRHNNKCDAAQAAMNADMGDVIIYNIYAPYDDVGPSKSAVHFLKQIKRLPSDVEYPEHFTDMELYLNRNDVQEALHVGSHVKWTMCNSKLNYSSVSVHNSMLDVYRWILKNSEIRILIYSGDMDACVPNTGSKDWITQGLKLSQSRAFRPWNCEHWNTGGYVTEYGKLTFTTVRGAGHMVPTDQRLRGFYMMSKFMDNEPF